MTIFQKVVNWYHIREHGYPSRKAIEIAYDWHMKQPNRYSGKIDIQKKSNRTSFKMAANYMWYDSINVVAEEANVPRERVRQVLSKIYRDYKKGLYETK